MSYKGESNRDIPLRLSLAIISLMSLLALFFIGCGGLFRDDFLKSPELLKQGQFFKQEYKRPGATLKKYKRIHFKPINLGFLDKNTVINSEFYSEDLNSLTRSLLSELKAPLRDEYFLVSRNSLRKNTLVVEVALTRLVSLAGADPRETTDPVARLLGLKEGRAELKIMLFDGKTHELLGQVSDLRVISEKRSHPIVSDSWEPIRIIFAVWGENLRAFIDSY